MADATIVYVLFATGYIEEYYQIQNFVGVFSTSEKAQAHIDSVLHQRKLNCKRKQLEETFEKSWEEKNPDPYENIRNIRDTKPKYDHTLQGDKEYNRRHMALMQEWRSMVEAYNNRMHQYTQAKTAATREYIETLDLERQDLSDVDLAYYGEENNFSIKPIELK